MNKKLKWKYDKEHNKRYALNCSTDKDSLFEIVKEGGIYWLHYSKRFISVFDKLSSAQKVAEIMRAG